MTEGPGVDGVVNKSPLEFSFKWKFKGYEGSDHVKMRGKEPECWR